MTAFKKILVPTDFSPVTAEAFRVAVGLAGVSGGEVVVAHVNRGVALVVENGQVTPAGAVEKSHNLWDDFRPTVTDAPNVHVTHEIVVASRLSVASILEMLEKFGCDLIVIGSHGHGLLHRVFRGSLTDQVVRQAHCPVLVVKAPAAAAAPVKARPLQTGKTA